MTQLKGRFWRTDDNGDLLNDCNRTHLTDDYQPLIQATIEQYTKHIGNDIHSIYMTGSIPRGRAQIGVSDADFFTVLERYAEPKLVMQDWIKPAQTILNEEFKHIVSKVDIELYPDGYVFRDPDEFSVGAFIIATHSICIWGSDLGVEVPRYNMNNPKIPLAIANDDIVQLLPDIEEAYEAIENDTSADNVAYWSRRISKNMIRAGFCLTMRYHNQHTRDIDLASDTFKQHYDNQTDAIDKTFAFIENPTQLADELLTHLDDFGDWLIDECDKWLDEFNPEGYDYFVYGDDPDYEP